MLQVLGSRLEPPLRFITYLTPSLPIELFELVARLAPTAEAALEVLA